MKFLMKVLFKLLIIAFKITYMVTSVVVLALLLCALGFTAAHIYPTVHQGYIREHVGSNVYMLYDLGSRGSGTGFSLVVPGRPTPVIITNDHICTLGVKEGKLVAISDQGVETEVKILKRSKTTDLCMLESPPATGLILSDSVYVGQRVQAVGHPGGLNLTLSNIGEIIQEEMKSVVQFSTPDKFRCDSKQNSMYKQKTMCVVTVPFSFKTNVIVKRGSSGSPLVTSIGDVVGVVYSVDEEGWASAITLRELKNFLKKQTKE